MHSIISFKNILCIGALALYGSSIFAAPITITVNSAMDNNLSTPNGGVFGATTDLRGALNQVNVSPNPDGYIINFSPNVTGPITLGAMLPILNLVQNYPLTIDGGQAAPITIDGNGIYRGFFANQGNIVLKNLQIQNVRATGGIGGNSAGGGMGAGAGLFINQAQVTISNVQINSARAIGGAGGLVNLNDGGGGGGGGLGGNGGNSIMGSGGSSNGGGGLGGSGGDGNQEATGGGGINGGGTHQGTGGTISNPATAGGGAGCAPGGASIGNPGLQGGGGGANIQTGGIGGGGGGCAGGNANLGVRFGGFGGGGGAGSDGNQADGGAGGFGGGGGGSGAPNSKGGSGGFGGGGGAANLDGSGGGDGGFGGGGAGSDCPSCPIPVGLGGVGGGNGQFNEVNSNPGRGGGGAGFGGAIFVNNSGSLTILDTFSSSTNSTTAGTGFKPGWSAGPGAFILTGGLLTLDPNGSTISMANSIADDSAASFVGVQPGTKAGSASGASITIGSTQNPAGTVQFPVTNNSTYSGPTLVKHGIFALDGTITSPVTVFSSGKLQGTGTVKNNVNINSGGSIHAGNSIGTLTVGNLALAENAILELDVNLDPGSSNSSIYLVNGTLTVNNATISLDYISPSSPPSSHAYNFIHSSGSVAGKFSPLVLNSPLGLFASVNYLPNIVQLQLAPFSTFLGSGDHLSHNEKAVLNYLLNLSLSPSLQQVLTSLAYLTTDDLKEALKSISPARNSAAAFFSNQNSFTMGKVSLDRFAERRISNFTKPKGRKNTLASTLTIKSENLTAMNDQVPTPNMPADFDVSYESCHDETLAYSLTRKTSQRKPSGNAKTIASIPQNYSLWGSGFGDFLSLDGQNSNPHISDTAAGAMVGFDYYGHLNGIFTISAGYVHNDISEAHKAGNGESNGGSLSFFGTGSLGNGYIEGGFLTGYNRFTMKRSVIINGVIPSNATAQSSFNDWVIMPHLSGGYDWMMDWGVIEPFASVDFSVSFQNSYKEKGAGILNANVKSYAPSILRSQFGLNFYETWECPKHAMIFQQTASYINKTLFSTNIHASLILPTPLPLGNPSAISLQTYDKTLNLGGVGAELFYKHKRSGFFLSGAYQGEFGTSYMSNNITGTVGIFF